MLIRAIINPRKGSSKTSATASISSAAGVGLNGAAQVNMFMNAHDPYGMRSVVATLTLSPAEARDLAERLRKHADEACDLMVAERKVKP
jgi:hypothetical protein